MPKIALTDATLRAITPPTSGQITYVDTKFPGFGVRISQGGTKSFVFIHGPNRTRTTIGRYPAISLKEARQQAKLVRAQLTLGYGKPQSTTYDDARDRFIEVCRLKNKPRTVYDYNRILNRHFRFGRKHVDDITRQDIANRLGKLKDTPSEQHHAYVTIRAFLNWALSEEMIEKNPIANMRQVGSVSQRNRTLSLAELKTVYCAAIKHPYPFGRILEFLILMGQRRGETAALQWSWIDVESRLVTLPSEITKNRREHTFPYGDVVADLLARTPRIKDNDHLFPSRVSTATIFNSWGKSKSTFDAVLDDVAHYTLHDLRRTYSTSMASIGTPVHVTEKLQNHIFGTTVSGVAAIYNRYDYIPEMREAVANYEKHLSDMAS